MERRRRAEPSPPGFSTLIALHNHGPGSRATQRPDASGQPSNPSRRGLAGLEPEPSSIESVLGGVIELAAPLAWPPGTTAALWQVFSGLDESKESISQRFAVALEQPTFHNYGPSIRTKTNVSAVSVGSAAALSAQEDAGTGFRGRFNTPIANEWLRSM